MSPKEASQSLENLELIKKADSWYKESAKRVTTFRKDQYPTASSKELKCGDVVKGFDKIRVQLEKQGKPDQVEVWRKQVDAYEAEHKPKTQAESTAQGQQGESTVAESEERTEEAESTPLIQQRFYIYRLIETDRSDYAMTVARDCVARGRPHPPLSKEDNLRRENCAEELSDKVLKIALDDKTSDFKDPAELEKLIATYHVTKETLLAIKNSNAFGGDSTQQVLAEQAKYQQVREAEEATREYESNKAHLSEYERRKKEDAEATVAPREAVEAKKTQYKSEASQALEEKRNKATGLLGSTLGSHDVEEYIGVKITLPSELTPLTLASLTEGQGQTIVAQLEPQLQNLRDAVKLSEALIQQVSGKDALQDSIKEYLFSVGRYDKFPATQIRKVTRQLPVFKQRLDDADRQKKADLISAVNQFFSIAGEHAFAIQEDDIDMLLADSDSMLTVCMTCDAQLRLKKTSLDTMQKEWNETMPYLSTASARSTQLRTAVQEYDKELMVVKDGYSPSAIPGGGGVDVNTWIKEDKASVRAETKPLVDAILKAIGTDIPFVIPDELESDGEDIQILELTQQLEKLQGESDDRQDLDEMIRTWTELHSIYEQRKDEVNAKIADDAIRLLNGMKISRENSKRTEGNPAEPQPSLEKQLQGQENIRLGEPYTTRSTRLARGIAVAGTDLNVLTMISNNILEVHVRTVTGEDPTKRTVTTLNTSSGEDQCTISLVPVKEGATGNLRTTVQYQDGGPVARTFTLEACVHPEELEQEEGAIVAATVDYIIYAGPQEEGDKNWQELIVREEIRAWLVKKDFTSSGAPQALEHLCLGNDLAMLLEVQGQVGADTTIQITEEQIVAVDAAIKRIKDAKQGGVPSAAGAGGSPLDGGGGGEPKDSIVDEAIGLKEGQNHFESVMYITLPLEEETLETNFFVGPHQYLQIGEQIAKVTTGYDSSHRPIVWLYFDRFQAGRDKGYFLQGLVDHQSGSTTPLIEIDTTHSYTWHVERVGEVTEVGEGEDKTTKMKIKIVCDVTTKAPEASGAKGVSRSSPGQRELDKSYISEMTQQEIINHKAAVIYNLSHYFLSHDVDSVVLTADGEANLSGEGLYYTEEEGMLFRIIEEGISARETDVPRYLEALRALIDLVSKFDPKNQNIPRLCLMFVEEVFTREAVPHESFSGDETDLNAVEAGLHQLRDSYTRDKVYLGMDIAYWGSIKVMELINDPTQQRRLSDYLEYRTKETHMNDILRDHFMVENDKAYNDLQTSTMPLSRESWQTMLTDFKNLRDNLRILGFYTEVTTMQDRIDSIEELRKTRTIKEYLPPNPQELKLDGVAQAISVKVSGSRPIPILRLDGEPSTQMLHIINTAPLKSPDYSLRVIIGSYSTELTFDAEWMATQSEYNGVATQEDETYNIGYKIENIVPVFEDEANLTLHGWTMDLTLTKAEGEVGRGEAAVEPKEKATILPVEIGGGLVTEVPRIVIIDAKLAEKIKQLTSDEGDSHRPAAIAELLVISAATLRRWTARFSEFLSPMEGGNKTRYSIDDAKTLGKVQELLEQGWTYEQVAEKLAQDPEVQKAVSQKGKMVSTATMHPATLDGPAPETSATIFKARLHEAIKGLPVSDGVKARLRGPLETLFIGAGTAVDAEMNVLKRAEAIALAANIPFASEAVMAIAEFVQAAYSVRNAGTGQITPESLALARGHLVNWIEADLKGMVELAEIAGMPEIAALSTAIQAGDADRNLLAVAVVRPLINRLRTQHAGNRVVVAICDVLDGLLSESGEQGTLTQVANALAQTEGFAGFVNRLKTNQVPSATSSPVPIQTPAEPVKAPEQEQPTVTAETPPSEPELSHELTLTATEVARQLNMRVSDLLTLRTELGDQLDAKFDAKVGIGGTMMYSEHDVQELKKKRA